MLKGRFTRWQRYMALFLICLTTVVGLHVFPLMTSVFAQPGNKGWRPIENTESVLLMGTSGVMHRAQGRNGRIEERPAGTVDSSIAELTETRYRAACFQNDRVTPVTNQFTDKVPAYLITVSWREHLSALEPENEHWTCNERWNTLCSVPPAEALALILGGSFDSEDELFDCTVYQNASNQVNPWLLEACLAFERDDLEYAVEVATTAMEVALEIDWYGAVLNEDGSIPGDGVPQAHQPDMRIASVKQFQMETFPVTGATFQMALDETATMVAEFVLSSAPPAGWVEAITGVDNITGEQLAWWERVLGLSTPKLRVVPGAVADGAQKIGEIISQLGRVVAERLGDLWRSARIEFRYDPNTFGMGGGNIKFGRRTYHTSLPPNARQLAEDLGFTKVDVPKRLKGRRPTPGAKFFGGRMPDDAGDLARRRVYISNDLGGHGKLRNEAGELIADQEAAWKVWANDGTYLGTFNQSLNRQLR